MPSRRLRDLQSSLQSSVARRPGNGCSCRCCPGAMNAVRAHVWRREAARCQVGPKQGPTASTNLRLWCGRFACWMTLCPGFQEGEGEGMRRCFVRCSFRGLRTCPGFLGRFATSAASSLWRRLFVLSAPPVTFSCPGRPQKLRKNWHVAAVSFLSGGDVGGPADGRWRAAQRSPDPRP